MLRLPVAVASLLVAAATPVPGRVAEPAPSPATAVTIADSACEALRGTRGADIVVSAATALQPAPRWESPAVYGRRASVGVRFCRVEGILAGRIGFELWLPAADRWNGRLLGAGVGGDAGVYNYTDLARGVEGGYAAITNDSGHKATEQHWMMRTDALQDYTHRSQHLMNQAGRTLASAYYGSGPHHAYFIGCSGGGRQALKEMQRYPQDYDGVIAGAGAPTMPIMSARHLWQALYQQRTPAGAMSDASWDLVAQAAVRACDANDGVVDGVVEDPAACRFDARSLQCRDGQQGQCLTAAQVQTVRSFYAPLRDESGRKLDNGLFPGVRTRPGPPSPLLLPLFAEGAHRDPAWQAEQFNMRADLELVDRMMPEMRADETNLRPFVARGGRAILYQGWMDPSVVAGQSIDYLQRVQQEMGSARTSEFMRLYMVPGMLHCGGGDGVSLFGGAADSRPIGPADSDLLSALAQWVEQRRPPAAIRAVRVEQGQVTRERLICPWPQLAHFLGGDSNDIARYQCGMSDGKGR